MGIYSGGPVDRGFFEKVMHLLDPAWIEEALRATGTATVRKRRLPAAQALWLVIGMSLFRGLSIVDLVDHLQLVLPGGQGRIARSAVHQRKAKLGAAPLQWLFEKCSQTWGLASADRWRWRGLRVFGLDGTTLRVPDSKANRREFGGQKAGDGRGESGYPQVRLVTLMTLRSHLLLAARFAAYAISERAIARTLFPLVPDDSLLVVDRNFAYAKDLIPYSSSGVNRQWLTRARKNHKWRVIKRLGPGDELAEIVVNRDSRRENPELPERWKIRVIKYRRRGFREQRLLTSLLASQVYPADEIRAMYHERWELELGFDEVKTEMLERQEAIRSQSPGGVAQELWGLGIAYNIVRLAMEQAAEIAGVPPVRMSFKSCFMQVRSHLHMYAVMSPGRLPKALARLPEDLSHFVLPPRRSDRIYPRAVKIKMSNYPRKRPPTPRRRRAAK